MSSGVAVFPAIISIVVLVFCGLMFVAGVVGAVLYFAGRPGSGVRRVGGALSTVCGLLLGGLMVLGFVVGMFLVGVRSTSREQQVRVQRQDELRRIGQELHQQAVREMQPTPKSVPPGPQGVPALPPDTGLKRLTEEETPVAPTDGASSTAAGTSDAKSAGPPHNDRTTQTDAAQPRPEWADKIRSQDGDVTLIVLSSKQYSTIEEARHEVAAEAMQLLKQDFEKIYGLSAGSANLLSIDTLKATAVKREYIETVDRDFGNFFAPMHRVWWQLELSPVVRSTLHQTWKAGLQEQRVLIVGAGFLAATVCLAGMSLLSHRRRPTPAAEAPPAQAAAVVLGVGALTLLAQRCKRWWRT